MLIRTANIAKKYLYRCIQLNLANRQGICLDLSVAIGIDRFCEAEGSKVTFTDDSENAVCVLVSSLQSHNKWSVFILCMLVFQKF